MTDTPRLPSLVPFLCGAAVVLAVSACGDKTPASVQEAAGALTGGKSLAFDDGADVCFREVSALLPAETKVQEISSYFGEDGKLQVCTVDYQDPQDPRKLVGQRFDAHSGKFSEPYQIELSVSGNAADFRLEDYLVPLSQVDTSGLGATVEGLKPSLDEVYGSYRWVSVNLESPGPFNEVHTLRLNLEGRLAANDVRNTGSAWLALGGNEVVRNALLP